jgi:hypothetical protein
MVGNGGLEMATKRPKPEEIYRKLRQVEVLVGQGQSTETEAAILGRFFVVQKPLTMRSPMTARFRPEDIE